MSHLAGETPETDQAGLDKERSGAWKPVDVNAAQEFEALPLGDEFDEEGSTHSHGSAG